MQEEKIEMRKLSVMFPKKQRVDYGELIMQTSAIEGLILLIDNQK